MILRGYGTELIRLRHEHIELVRRHRNSQRISQYMEYRETISPEMQETWFRSIDNHFNNYFLIRKNDEFIGLINGAQIDWEKKETRSGGIFIWDESFWQTPEPLKASLLLTDISFLLGLERTYIRVLRTNPRAIRFNLQLGYELLPGQDEVENQEYVLSRENYYRHTARLRELMRGKSSEPFLCIIDHPENDSEKFILEFYSGLPAENRQQLLLRHA
jgi:RimJ/RimL family protein N-acetyltransferase